MDNINCSAYIDNIKFEREFVCGKTNLLFLSIQYFCVHICNSQTAEDIINRTIQRQVRHFYKNAADIILTEAYVHYLETVKNDYPFNNYEAYLVYNITLNDNCYLSFYKDDYQYTGGAHGMTIRSSDTYNLCSGKKIPLCSYFDRGTKYKELLINLIQMQAEENYIANPGIYFENYKELIAENFNAESYYLTENSISIYYQQYEIAPYSSGIIVFDIPYSIAACPPSC